MNEDKGYLMTCPKCGAEMNSTARYCMKCGYLNTDHEANQNMKPYIKNVKNSYQVGSGNLIVNDENSTSQINIASNTGSNKLCFLITYGIYIILVLLVLWINISNGVNSFDTLILSTIPINLIVFSVIFIYIYSIELVFMKANKPWWAGLVPFYNLIVLGEITFHKKYIGIISFIPIIGQIFILVMFYKLGEKFKYSPLLTMLLSIIYVPIIGFGDNTYEGKTFVNSGEKNSTEKSYRMKKVFMSTLILLLIAGVVFYVMGNFGKLEKTGQLFGNNYYVYASNKAVKEVSLAVEEERIKCDNQKIGLGTYYIYYPDLGDEVFLPFYMMREPIQAYVKIEKSNSDTKYYISLTDGEYGIKETNSAEVSLESVVSYDKLTHTSSNCEVLAKN